MSVERKFGDVVVHDDNTSQPPAGKPKMTPQIMVQKLSEAREKYRELHKRNAQLGEHFDTLKAHYFELRNENEDVLNELEDSKTETASLQSKVEELTAQVAALQHQTSDSSSNTSGTHSTDGEDLLLKVESLQISNEYLREQIRESESTESTLRTELEETKKAAESLRDVVETATASTKAQFAQDLAKLREQKCASEAALAKAEAEHEARDNDLKERIAFLEAESAKERDNKEQVIAAVREAVTAEIRAEAMAKQNDLKAQISSLQSNLASSTAEVLELQQLQRVFSRQNEELTTALKAEQEKCAQFAGDDASKLAGIEAERDAATLEVSALKVQVERLKSELKNAEEDKVRAYHQNKRKIDELQTRFHTTEYETRYAELVAENLRLKATAQEAATTSKMLRENAIQQKNEQEKAAKIAAAFKNIQHRLQREHAELAKLQSKKANLLAKRAAIANADKLQAEVATLKSEIAERNDEQMAWKNENQKLHTLLSAKILEVNKLQSEIESKQLQDDQETFDKMEENATLKETTAKLEKVRAHLKVKSYCVVWANAKDTFYFKMQALEEATKAHTETLTNHSANTQALEKAVAEANIRVSQLEAEMLKLTTRANEAEELVRSVSTDLETEQALKLELQGENTLISEMLRQHEQAAATAVCWSIFTVRKLVGFDDVYFVVCRHVILRSSRQPSAWSKMQKLSNFR